MQKIEQFNYDVGKVECWGTKLMTYPIKKENKGHYVLYILYDNEKETKTKETKFIKEIEKLQAEDKILKFVMVRY